MPLTASQAAIGAGLGLNAKKNNKASAANSRAVSLAEDNSAFIKNAFPTSSVLNFPGGNFSFSSTPEFSNVLGNVTPATPGYRDNDAGNGGGAPWVPGTPGSGVTPEQLGSAYTFNFEGGVEGANNSVFDSISKEFADIGKAYGGLDLNIDQLSTVNDRIEGLLPQVAVGSSRVREAGLNQLTDAENASSSNLKGSLDRRRVLGSSFANDALSRNEAEFGRKRADFEAQTILQEIDSTAKLLDFQKNVATRSAEVLTAKLSGQQSAAQGRLATETNRTQLNQNAAIANMQAAFQGQQQSMAFISSMANAINQSTGIITGSLNNTANSLNTEGELFGDVAAGLITNTVSKSDEDKRADAK